MVRYLVAVPRHVILRKRTDFRKVVARTRSEERVCTQAEYVVGIDEKLLKAVNHVGGCLHTTLIL